MFLLILLLVTTIPSGLVAYFAIGLVRRYAERLGLVDQPGARKVHAAPVPLGGGIGIWAGTMATFALGTVAVLVASAVPSVAQALPDSVSQHLEGLVGKIAEIWVICGCATVLMILGLIDDRYGIKWTFRLAVEFGVAGICVYWQGLQLTAFIDFPWLTSLMSVIWIVALINSFNMLDNMDGLSGGVATISSAILATMLLVSNSVGDGRPQIFVAAMLFVLIGALVGFLRHNWPPAKIFMGDAGSYFIGFWIAVATLLATYAGYQNDAPHAVLTPLIVMAIPLYDMCSVIVIRLLEGRSPFDADKRHFSHRLVDLGMSKKQAVMTIYLATAACSMGALLLPQVDTFGAAVILITTLLMLALVQVLESVKRESDDFGAAPITPSATEVSADSNTDPPNS